LSSRVAAVVVETAEAAVEQVDSAPAQDLVLPLELTTRLPWAQAEQGQPQLTQRQDQILFSVPLLLLVVDKAEMELAPELSRLAVMADQVAAAK
jgi:hypothetical protein